VRCSYQKLIRVSVQKVPAGKVGTLPHYLWIPTAFASHSAALIKITCTVADPDPKSGSASQTLRLRY
jgi:hypothetical protein